MTHGGAAGQLDHGLGLLAVATHAVSQGVVNQHLVVCEKGRGGKRDINIQIDVLNEARESKKSLGAEIQVG